MTKKKAKGKTETKGKIEANNKAAKKDKVEEKKLDLAEVRKSIAVMVTDQAEGITLAVVADALKGQLATVKYLFEVAGVYPASTDGSGVLLEDDSLARTLLDRLNLPFTPLPPREDDDERVQVAVAKVAAEDADEKDPSSEDVDSEGGSAGENEQ
jgi:hypothetical protein